jgi:addiction module RelE/StbE family toxin
MKIIYTSKFAREYKKLPSNIKSLAEEKEAVFRINPFDPNLKTHKLHGKLKDFWSFSVGYKYRIVFEISKGRKEAFYFHAAGNHDIYQ